MLDAEFKKKYNAENNTAYKTGIKQDFVLFMKKMDSIENIALIGALLQVKNLEDLSRLHPKTDISTEIKYDETTSAKEISPEYPGGINVLKQEIVDLFYGEAVYSEVNIITSKVVFVVEKDGTISEVKAEGDNFTFNRQAEIAIYSISKPFSPALINGQPVRYRFRLPLTLNLE